MAFRNRVSSVLGTLAVLSLTILAVVKTEGFDEKKIYAEQKGELPNRQLSLDCSVLSQPFFYLGHGRQCYAFASKDGRYVIKFFNFSAHKKPFLLSSLPLPQSVCHIFERKEKRKKGFFTGYKLDALLAKEEPKITATLWVHLQQEMLSQKELVVYDQWHQKHKILLQKTAFIVQRRVEPFLSWLEEAPSLFQERLGVYLDFLFLRLSHQIFDPDGRILEHLGLVEGALVSFDHGRIFFHEKLKEAAFFEEKIFAETRQMRKYLQEYHPEYMAFFEAAIQTRVQAKFSKK